MFCISCGSKVPARARFCAKCGMAIDEADPNATVLGEASAEDANLETIAPYLPLSRLATPQPRTVSSRSRPPTNPALTTSDPIGGGRFAPGAIVADRYRVVALLGRGGMGEVYRAEDLRLSQVLAIKFLPEALSKDDGALARFHSEVRVARQVSHPNVCRVFDIGDANGVPFLTMEYVDGEDLSSLVRRIGRLPQDKAVEVSRQICAGLAAAHERGVVHRDLKPSNVMLDGAGKARITDFGLAGIATSIKGADIRAGTPAYMAPEQLAGEEVTVKSDIYSLGLVMYEVLTGRRAYDAMTLPELMQETETRHDHKSFSDREGSGPADRARDFALRGQGSGEATELRFASGGGATRWRSLGSSIGCGRNSFARNGRSSRDHRGCTPAFSGGVYASCAGPRWPMHLSWSPRERAEAHPTASIRPKCSSTKLGRSLRIWATPNQAHDFASGFNYDDDYLDYLTRRASSRGNVGANLDRTARRFCNSGIARARNN